MTSLRRHLYFSLCLSIAAACVGLSVSAVQAARQSESNADARLIASWEGVENYLPQSPAGNDWRTFLLMPELRQQIDQGLAADPDQVAQILKRFHFDHPFLQADAFTAVREELSDWLPRLDAAHPEKAIDLAKAELTAFEPPTDAEVADIIQQMRTVTLEMDRFLATAPQVRAGWENYFNWDRWQAEMKRSDLPDPEMLNSVARRLQSAADMFPDPICQKAGRIFRTGTQEIYRKQTSTDDVKKWLGSIVRIMQIPNEKLSSANTVELSAANVWLQRRGIGGRVLSAVLALHSRPNFRIAVSQRLLASGVDADVNVTSPFTDVIQGTTYRGTSRTQGRVTLNLLPNPRQIAMELTSALTITSSSTGYNDRATVQSGSTTNITGKKLATLDASGLKIYPATASAGTNSQIYGVQSSGVLGRRRVNSGAQDGKASTEYQVSRQAENRLENELDRATAQALAPIQRTLQNDLRRSLILVDGSPQHTRAWSTRDFAYLIVTQAGLAQLGAPSNAPGVREPSDLMLQIHESFVKNMGDSLLAGKTYTEEEIQSLWSSLFGTVPDSFKNQDPDNPWRIQFGDDQPIEVSIDDGHLVFTLRANAFHVGPETYPAMNITAYYELDTNGAGLVATRKDRLDIEPPDLEQGQRLGARMSALRTMIRKRFDPIFPENWEAKTFQLASHANDHPEVKVRKVIADDGWISLAGEMVNVPVLSRSGQSTNNR